MSFKWYPFLPTHMWIYSRKFVSTLSNISLIRLRITVFNSSNAWFQIPPKVKSHMETSGDRGGHLTSPKQLRLGNIAQITFMKPYIPPVDYNHTRMTVNFVYWKNSRPLFVIELKKFSIEWLTFENGYKRMT